MVRVGVVRRGLGWEEFDCSIAVIRSGMFIRAHWENMIEREY